MDNKWNCLIFDDLRDNETAQANDSQLESHLEFLERKVDDFQTENNLTDSEMQERQKIGFISCKHGADISFYDIYMKSNN